ncbi:MAG: CBS domain-containing protein [Acidimicrobiia bacterium]
MVRTVRQIMSDPLTCPASTPVAVAARLMRDRGVADVIVETDVRVRGIVTDRDITVRVVAEGEDPRECQLLDICRGGVVTTAPDTSLEDAARLMRDHAVRRIVVTEHDEPIGVVSLDHLAMELDDRSTLAQIGTASAHN